MRLCAEKPSQLAVHKVPHHALELGERKRHGGALPKQPHAAHAAHAQGRKAQILATETDVLRARDLAQRKRVVGDLHLIPRGRGCAGGRCECRIFTDTGRGG
jgi:hypothetical protein